nr:MAG TPA: hypothetical protein [Caudoviricetes sp.]
MATRSTPIPTTAPRARSSCCPQPGFHPSGSRRSKAVCTDVRPTASNCGCCTPGQSSRPNGATRYGAKRNCNSSISSPS